MTSAGTCPASSGESVRRGGDETCHPDTDNEPRTTPASPHHRRSKCNSNEGDCLTPKGYAVQTLSLDGSSASVDVYDIHTDAGDDSGDHTARNANFAQLAAAIAKNSGDRAVIVMGDSNSRYTNAVDDFAGFVHTAGLTDPWIALHRGGVEPQANSTALKCADPVPADDTCETVDKILYKSGGGVKLSVSKWEYAAKDFLNSTGGLLSDHSPVQATFQWSLE